MVAAEVARLGERGIEHRRGVALREHEAIAARPLGVGCVVAHDAAEEQHGDDVGCRERAAGVAAAGLGDHLDDVGPHPRGLRA